MSGEAGAERDAERQSFTTQHFEEAGADPDADLALALHLQQQDEEDARQMKLMERDEQRRRRASEGPFDWLDRKIGELIAGGETPKKGPDNSGSSEGGLASLSAFFLGSEEVRLDESRRKAARKEARARLRARLQLYGLGEFEVSGDGNCQFAATADQLFRDPTRHTEVRAAAVRELRSHPELYSPFVVVGGAGEGAAGVGDWSAKESQSGFEGYCSELSHPGTWGDHVTLQAISNAYGVQICLVTTSESQVYIEVSPREASSSRVLWLSFWSQRHYNSLYPLEALDQRVREEQSDCVIA
jgi:OTU-like cysteine protease